VGGKKEVARSRTATGTGWLESPYLRRVAVRVARQHGLREDDFSELLQELRIAVWQAGAASSLTAAWLFGVASHKAVDMVRLKARAHRIDQDLAAIPSQSKRDFELDHLLHARVDHLPKRLRQFYDLHYQQGLSEREIARSLGVCRASVRWMDRCCRRLVAGPDVSRRSR
jgi:RNA polymerase sigma factor (sigma-70 family)